MELVQACCLLIIVSSVSTVYADEEANHTSTNNGTLEDSHPIPAHSMHRLIPSVMDTISPDTNSTASPFSPGNITDTAPFLPSGVHPSYRNSQLYQPESKSNEPKANFTPSYFIGEVIPEPYVPEKFQNSRAGQGRRNSSIRSYQNPVASQTTFAFHKIIPLIEQMKHIAAPDSGVDNDHHAYLQEHVPPVHQPLEEDTTTPQYAVNYEDETHNADRPYKFYGENKNPHSTKPITFEEHQHNDYNFENHGHEHLRYQENEHGGHHYGYSAPYDSHSHPTKGHDDPFLGHPFHPKPHKDDYNGLSDYFKGNAEHPVEDYLNHHNHHEADFVLPSPFYPPEHDYPASHHKNVHYKVHQQKPKSALHGLLHFAAALLPLGLFVAALQPSVIHVNDSQPMMPPKQRSLEDGLLPGLEALQTLGDSDCEKRAFCELAVLGARPGASLAQRGLWKLAHSLPYQYESSLGLTEMLKAVKSASCSSIRCETNTNSSDKGADE